MTTMRPVENEESLYQQVFKNWLNGVIELTHTKYHGSYNHLQVINEIKIDTEARNRAMGVLEFAKWVDAGSQ